MKINIKAKPNSCEEKVEKVSDTEFIVSIKLWRPKLRRPAKRKRLQNGNHLVQTVRRTILIRRDGID